MSISPEVVAGIWRTYFQLHPDDENKAELQKLCYPENFNSFTQKLRAGDKRIPAWVLNELSKIQDFEFVIEIASQTHSSSETLENIYSVITNKQNFATEEMGATITQTVTLARLAKNPNLSPQLATQLCNNFGENIGIELLRNPATPDEVYQKFFDTDDFNIMEALAENVRTPEWVLEQIHAYTFVDTEWDNNYVDEDDETYFPAEYEYIYVALLNNPKLPASLVERISVQKPQMNTVVGERIFAHPNYPLAKVLEAFPVVGTGGKMLLAKRITANLPSQVQDLLKVDPDNNVRFNLASNSRTDKNVHIFLLEDEDIDVRSWAATLLFIQKFFGDWPTDWVEAHYGVKILS